MSYIALAGALERPVRRTTPYVAEVTDALTAEIAVGTAAYDDLSGDWRRLASRRPGGAVLFQMPSLLRIWARHFAAADATDLITVVVRRRGRPVLIWPLFKERRLFVDIVTGAGGPIGQYDECLIDPDCDMQGALAAALDVVRRDVRPDLVLLERVRESGALRAALGAIAPVCREEAAPFSDLSHGAEALRVSLKSRVLRQQRKRVRRFAEEGAVAFELAGSAEEARAWLIEAMALKRDWLKTTGRLSRAFLKPETGNCLADLAGALVDRAALPEMIVSRLTLDGRTAAIEMGFRQGDTYHLYLGAFAPEFAKHGPGNILTEHVLDWCAANGILRYDMLAPRSRNKSEWQSGEVEVLDFALPMTASGRFYLSVVLLGLVPAARRAFYALPAPLRSTLAGLALRI